MTVVVNLTVVPTDPSTIVPELSRAVKTTLYAVSAVTVGSVPLAPRVDASNVIPGGRPDTLYLYGGTPPVAAGNVVFTEPPDGSRKSGMLGKESPVAVSTDGIPVTSDRSNGHAALGRLTVLFLLEWCRTIAITRTTRRARGENRAETRASTTYHRGGFKHQRRPEWPFVDPTRRGFARSGA
ncbi:MAG: hypothetical protein OXI49_15760 [Acidobacteriota bacterium]|nr:hypothetical protein [Acidobacteriota bacterium]